MGKSDLALRLQGEFASSDDVKNIIVSNVEDLKNVFDRIETYPRSMITHRGDIKPLLEKILGK